MRTHHKPLGELVLIEVRQQLRCTGGVAPVAHEIRSKSKVGLDLYTGHLHTAERLTSDALVKGAGCFGGDVDRVPFLDKQHREELDVHLAEIVRMLVIEDTEPVAYISCDASSDNLLLARGLNVLAKVGVVPCVDLAIALDERRILVHD